jgi:hypothetical protein
MTRKFDGKKKKAYLINPSLVEINLNFLSQAFDDKHVQGHPGRDCRHSWRHSPGNRTRYCSVSVSPSSGTFKVLVGQPFDIVKVVRSIGKGLAESTNAKMH